MSDVAQTPHAAALQTLFDAPVLRALGLYREEAYTAHGGHQSIL